MSTILPVLAGTDSTKHANSHIRSNNNATTIHGQDEMITMMSSETVQGTFSKPYQTTRKVDEPHRLVVPYRTDRETSVVTLSLLSTQNVNEPSGPTPTGPAVIPWAPLQPVTLAFIPPSQVQRILSTFASDVKDVLATSLTVGLSVALGMSMNRFIGALLDRYLPGDPSNMQHQAIRVVALAIIVVLMTFLVARVIRPKVSITGGAGGLIQQTQQQLSQGGLLMRPISTK